ncbi:proline/betaine transporter [Alcaligenes pakistanensis]|uniref:Proline/betaine transporter n=1 Tax=Alcaligenes pakistanensis TaxID=1482717 RepID=A0A8H9IL94_9BURK|nr:glycine betaine/L-proline transporter ProP [Alcaligenes pakistanensis]MBP6621028.1 glycine betaine/L-proline transporter ProP [Alcaligenes sp.]GHC51112.1 proline/betaine transporter [Alcaligenes pakistanensis]HCA17968.1 proline/glycine betaine transporter ProP [Alcaligenes faecalis]
MTQSPAASSNAKPLHIDDITVVDNSKLKKAVTAAALGNAMEWFDFGVYGFVAATLGKVFFPDASPAVQTIAALGTFSVPFLVRPLGGVFFGLMGDKFGRQKVLSITIIIMAISTFLIGLIPSYLSIGLWAPILLLLCKLAQGFSVGGEYTGAAVFVAEYAPDRQRGFLGSWLDFGSIAGFVLGAGLVVLLQTSLTEANFLEWGWRIPFLIAGPLGVLGLYLRHAAEETPAFIEQLEKMEQEDRAALQERPTVSFREIFSKYRKALLICIGMVLVTNITYYMLLTYMPTYLSSSLGYAEEHGVFIIVVVMIGMLFVQPVVGFVSDKIGRKPFLLAGSLGLFLFAIPAFHFIGSDSNVQIFLGLLILAVLLNCLTGVMASTLPALFPTRLRYSALAASFNIAIIVAGLTPTVAAWLVERTDNLMVPAYYLMFASVIGLITALFLPETANRPLRGDTPTASNRKEAKELLQQAYDHIEQSVQDVEEAIAKAEEDLEALKQKRQRLVDRHPELD